MRKQPLILITGCTHQRGVEFADASLSLSDCYANAIAAAGGLPLVLPYLADDTRIPEYVRRADGVMLTGGEDVQTDLYWTGVPPALKETVMPEHPRRDCQELLIIRELFRQKKPLLGICRGIQLLNVAFGGGLIVDIRRQFPEALPHRRSDRKDEIVHEVQLTPGSLLRKITGKSMLGVNSSHHQAVASVADIFNVTAASRDGIIEGLELRPETAALLPFMVAVQFHPERLFKRFPEHLRLFVAFINACGGNRSDAL